MAQYFQTYLRDKVTQFFLGRACPRAEVGGDVVERERGAVRRVLRPFRDAHLLQLPLVNALVQRAEGFRPHLPFLMFLVFGVWRTGAGRGQE